MIKLNAVIGVVKKLEVRLSFPSLHHRKEGWLRHPKNFAKPPKQTQPGWFSLCINRKTTPASRSADASRHSLGRSATPPCGDARRGIALFQFFHRSTDRAYSTENFEFRDRN